MEEFTMSREAKGVRICIDTFNNYEVYGRLYHYSQPEAVAFAGILELFFKLDALWDELDQPQRSHELRSFKVSRDDKSIDTYQKKELKQRMTEKELAQENGNKATFVVEVQYRRNNSWQGTLRWLDGNKTEHFRSTMELLKLIDSALEGPEDEFGQE